MKIKISLVIGLFFCFTSNLILAQLFPVTQGTTYGSFDYGYMDKSGKIIVPFIYKNAADFSENLALVMKNDTKVGYINTSGEEVISCQYDKGFDFKNGYAIVGLEKESFLIDKNGTRYPITNLVRSTENFYSEGLIVVENKQQKKGFANLKNEIVIPCQFDFASPFSEGHSIVGQNGKIYLIDLNKNKKELEFLSAFILNEGLIAVLGANELWGAIDSSLEYVIDFNYIDLYPFQNGYAPFREFFSMGLMKPNGEIVLPADYTFVYPFSENRVIVQTSDSVAILLDENFNILKELPNFYNENREELIFKSGLCKMYLKVPPTAASNDDNVQNYGGIALSYINLQGEIVWQSEPYYKED